MRKKILVWAMSISAFVVCAQNQPKILTFEEAVKIALRNGMLLNQQRNNLQFNQMLRTSAYAGLGPTLSATVQAYQTNGNSFIQQQGVVNGTVDAFNGFLNANINLFNGFSQINRVKQANNALDAQLYFVNRTAQDIINTVATQYLTVLADKELLRIAIENSTAQEKLLLQIQEQVKLGARSPVDEYNQMSLTKAAQLRGLQAEVNLVNDRALLAQTLLIDSFEDLELTRPDWDINESSKEVELTALYDVALKQRGDYLRAVKNERSAKFTADFNRALMVPTLSAFASYGSAYNKKQGDNTALSFSEQFKVVNVRKQYGLQLNIPILGGFQNRTTYVQQRVNYLNSKFTLRNAEVLVKTDVYRAYQNLRLY